jgi:predicted MFS family arabinose efflux permease
VAFTKVERGLIGGASFLVFTRVFAFSLTAVGFTEYAARLALAQGLSQADADLWAGIAFGAYGLTMAFAQLASGWLSDRVGRRAVLAGGSLLFIAGAVLCALTSSIWLLVAGRLVSGLGGVSSVALAAVGETVPEERRTRAMALVGIPAGLGVFLGFVVGPLVMDKVGFASLFWAVAALGLLAALPSLRPLPAPLPGLAHPERSLSPAVLALGLAGFCVNFAMTLAMFNVASSVLPLIGHWALAGILVAALVLMGGASRRLDKGAAASAAIALSLVLLAVGAAFFRLADSFGAAVVAGVVFFAAHATLSAALPSQVSKLAGRAGGLGHGMQLVLAYLGSAAGGLAAGRFAAGLLPAFLLLGTAALLAALLVLRFLAPRPAAARVPQP